MRFKDFTDEELDILEDSLCEYGCCKYMIDEIRRERDRRRLAIGEVYVC